MHIVGFLRHEMHVYNQNSAAVGGQRNNHLSFQRAVTATSPGWKWPLYARGSWTIALCQRVQPRHLTAHTNQLPEFSGTSRNTFFADVTERCNFGSFALNSYCCVGRCHFLFDNLRKERPAPLVSRWVVHVVTPAAHQCASCGTGVENRCSEPAPDQLLLQSLKWFC